MSGVNVSRLGVFAAAAGAVMAMAASAQGQYLPIYGGPTYDAQTQTGFGFFGAPPDACAVNNYGTAVSSAPKYVAGARKGTHGVRWGPGLPTDELGDTTSPDGAQAAAFAINDAGTAVGYSQYYVPGCLNELPIRWYSGGTVPTILDGLTTEADGETWARGRAINDAGTAVGWSLKYVGGVPKGYRPVRWEAGGTAVTELDIPGTDAQIVTDAWAYAINAGGTVAGYYRAPKYTSHTSDVAAKWDAGGAATELGNLGIMVPGITMCIATGINNAGTAIGCAWKPSRQIAVRWDAGGTTATVLGDLGARSDGVSSSMTSAINSAGTIVGWSTKYVDGYNRGKRAVRWDAGSTAARELGNLGTDQYGVTTSYAYAISDTGTAVGYANKYVGGTLTSQCAVLWSPAGAAFDLNWVIDTSSGWTTLDQASAISSNGQWIAGYGEFDPDGSGPLNAYLRLFVMPTPGPEWHWGNATHDDRVNVDDLGVLATNYGLTSGAEWGMADFTGDGAVNVDDLGILASNYDWVAPGGAGVPEPAALSLLTLAATALIRRRR